MTKSSCKPIKFSRQETTWVSTKSKQWVQTWIKVRREFKNWNDSREKQKKYGKGKRLYERTRRKKGWRIIDKTHIVIMLGSIWRSQWNRKMMMNRKKQEFKSSKPSTKSSKKPQLPTTTKNKTSEALSPMSLLKIIKTTNDSNSNNKLLKYSKSSISRHLSLKSGHNRKNLMGISIFKSRKLLQFSKYRLSRTISTGLRYKH